MEVRLNKLISDSGLCSRREADKFIEEGRVTVNGSLPQVGQKVTEGDIVMLDDIQVKIGKHTGKQTSSARINIQKLELAGQKKRRRRQSPCLRRHPKRRWLPRQPAQKACAPANM